MRSVPSGPDRSNEELLVDHELGAALSHGLDMPLAALRASMEALGQRLAEEGESGRLLDGVLSEVERIGRNVRELMDYATPPSPMPLRCTASEIAIAARKGLPTELRERVLLARDQAAGFVSLDAPLVARSLRRVLQNALEAGSDDVLVVARCSADGISFHVVDHAPATFDTGWARSAFHSTKRNHLGLGLSITERDVALMGGTLEVERTPNGETVVVMTIPDQDSRDQEAAA